MRLSLFSLGIGAKVEDNRSASNVLSADAPLTTSPALQEHG